MAPKSEKSFRTAVAGFNRQDVLDYISAMAKEHKEQTDAYRAGADKLRAERDAFAAQAALLPEQQELVRQLKAGNAHYQSEIASLSAEKAEAVQTEAELKSEINVLYARVEALEDELQVFSAAKLRAEEMESQAYRRAEEIENEASSAVEKITSAAQTSVHDLRSRLAVIKADGEKSAYSVVLELDKMRAWYVHYADLFDETLEKLNEICGDNVPEVREFVPKEFE